MDNLAAPIPSVPLQPAVEPPTVPPPAETSGPRWLLWLIAGLVLLALGIAIGIFLPKLFSGPTISNYENCLAAKGSRVQESYPATCVTASGRRFIQPVSSPTPEPVAPAVDPTADWKTYTSISYGFSFKHPNMDEKCCGISGAVSNNPANVIVLADISTTTPGTDAPFDGLSVYAVEKGNTTFSQYIEKEKAALKKQFEIMADPGQPHMGKVVENIVSGQKAVSLVDYSWDRITRTYFEHPNGKYILEVSKTEQSPGHFKLFDQILSTFKFTD
ncbi:hypothetical protein HYU89_04275 [Candidatus Collierbacteria bacterium]|nr:hypothetical protein [Candidatus Collierbacteria bacterium]